MTANTFRLIALFLRATMFSRRNIMLIKRLFIVLCGALSAVVLVVAAGHAARSAAPQGGFPGDDLLIGAPYEDVRSVVNAGSFNVLYGVSGGNLDTSYSPLWTQDTISDGVETDDYFASALAAGDFNGDGFVDAAVGVPGEDIESWDGLIVIEDAGAVNILYNSPAGLTNVGSQFWEQSDTEVAVTEAGDAFGTVLAVGDFNGDSYDDLAIGVPVEDVETEGEVFTDTGAVIVLYGAPGALSANGAQLFTQQGLASAGFTPQAYDYFGYALAAGDFNADGYDDLAVGAPLETADVGGLDAAGAVAVLYGSRNGGLSTAGAQKWTQSSTGAGFSESGDRFGKSLTAGDFNGDGCDDLAIGVPREDIDTTSDAGAVNVLYCAANHASGLSTGGSQVWWQTLITNDSGTPYSNSEVDDYFGLTLAAGDFDADGYDDLLIGVPWEDIGGGTNNGAAHILFGSDTGTNIANTFFWYDESGDRFASALTTGDFDRDGSDDFAAGVPGHTVNGAVSAGGVHVFYSRGSFPILFPYDEVLTAADIPGIAPETGDFLGGSLAVIPPGSPRSFVYLPLVIR